MPASAHLDRGDGPVVVLLHGVGVGPDHFSTLVDLLDQRFRVVVVDRPGGRGEAVPSLEDQADQVADLLVGIGVGAAQVIGVSGGATLGLVIAVRHPDLVAGLVLHEPLVGHHAPELHRRFLRAAARAASGDEGTMEVVQAVMGPGTWSTLGIAGQAAARAQVDRWRDEIARFAAFDPSLEDLVGLRSLPFVTTVGAQSGPERGQAATVLERTAHATVVEVSGAGNAAHLDAPDAFAAIIESWCAIGTGGRS